MTDYERYAGLFKALSDEKRLKIVDMLSCGELCACEILRHFDFTQSALSQHMKVLLLSGLVIADRRGTWMHYTLNLGLFEEFKVFLAEVCASKDSCICREGICQG